jgi:glycosyltransferase involved in cell wall biosynthesis
MNIPFPSAPIHVSYVVATRNRFRHVREALPLWRSLKRQDDEIIVIDGGSTDGTYELLKSEEGGLVDRLIHEKDRSEAHALNKALLLAKGELIKGLTDDDVFFLPALERAYDEMRAHPEIDLLITGGESIDLVINPRNVLPHHYQWYPDGLDLESRHEYVTMNGLGMVIRRSSLPLIGLYDPRHLHADTSFLTQATVRGATIRYIRVKGYRHLVGPQSMSLKNVRKTYIYDSFGFRGLSRWRYLKRPHLVLPWFWRKLFSSGPGIAKEPLWDAKIL